jgi:curved DNA-binding protein CbpA
MQTYYDILEISVTAGNAEIKSAFRRLAKLYHPDKNPNGKDHFEKILIAYEVLIDPGRRRQYDLKIKYGSGAKSTSSSGSKKKSWSFTEEEMKRRQYYQENYKSQFKKASVKREPIKKSYNEYKYILFATPLAVGLLMFIINAYEPAKKIKERIPKEKEIKSLTMYDLPFSGYFKNPLYDTASKYEVKIENPTGYEVVFCLFDSSGRFLRSGYIQPEFRINIGHLPKQNMYMRFMVGHEWNRKKLYGNPDVIGGFEKDMSYYELNGAKPGQTVIIDSNFLNEKNKIGEAEFFKRAN